MKWLCPEKKRCGWVLYMFVLGNTHHEFCSSPRTALLAKEEQMERARVDQSHWCLFRAIFVIFSIWGLTSRPLQDCPLSQVSLANLSWTGSVNVQYAEPVAWIDLLLGLVWIGNVAYCDLSHLFVDAMLTMQDEFRVWTTAKHAGMTNSKVACNDNTIERLQPFTHILSYTAGKLCW